MELSIVSIVRNVGCGGKKFLYVSSSLAFMTKHLQNQILMVVHTHLPARRQRRHSLRGTLLLQHYLTRRCRQRKTRRCQQRKTRNQKEQRQLFPPILLMWNRGRPPLIPPWDHIKSNYYSPILHQKQSMWISMVLHRFQGPITSKEVFPCPSQGKMSTLTVAGGMNSSAEARSTLTSV